MNIIDVIKQMMTLENMNYSVLGAKMGYTSRSAIPRIIDNGNPTVSTLIEMCNAMDFEIQIVSKKKYDSESGAQKKVVLPVTDARKKASREK
ncbi:MAG: helix-turn-helix domain-containing protein [Prevotella sp.]